MNKKGLSPIIATILLIAFAVAIGAMIMSWTTGVTESSACDTLPESVLSPNAFCKSDAQIVPRVASEEGKYTVCKAKAINTDNLATC